VPKFEVEAGQVAVAVVELGCVAVEYSAPMVVVS